MLRPLAFALGFLLCASSLMAQTPPLQAYDQRAAAALFTLLEPMSPAGKRKEWDPAAINQTEFDRLPVHNPSADHTKYVFYNIHFSAPEVGAYKILVGSTAEATDIAQPADATAPRWVGAPGNDPTDRNKAAFFYKKVDAGPRDEDKFWEVVSRQKIGGLMLSVVWRRPTNRDIDDALKQVNTRHQDLVAMAQKYRLLRTGGIFLKLLSDDGATELTELAAAPRALGLSDTPRTATVRVKIIDVDGKPLDNIRRVTIDLTGWMAASRVAPVTLGEVKGGRRDAGRIILDNPAAGFIDVPINLPARSQQAETEIFQQLATPGGGVGLRVGVKLKL